MTIEKTNSGYKATLKHSNGESVVYGNDRMSIISSLVETL